MPNPSPSNWKTKHGEALIGWRSRPNRSVDDLVNQAVRDYLALQEWQRQKIAAGIAAADRYEFATEEELARIAGKYSMLG
jgi:predicted transcriptional regulator